MSKAPRIKPANTKKQSPCGLFFIYTYWTPSILADGSVVFHKHINRRPKARRDENGRSIKQRKPRKHPDAPLTQNQQKVEKRKLLNRLKHQILNNDKYTLDNTRKLYEKFATPAIISAW
jgi:hypothetical protein